MMPEMDGVELAVRLQTVCLACEVLLFSDQAKTADLLEAARNQGYQFDILAKPVHPKELLAALVGL